MSKISYKLEGLNCANCAIKIEEKTKNIDKIKDAQLVFSTQKLNIEIEDISHLNEVQSKIKALVKSLEPDVKVIEITSQDKDLTHTYSFESLKKDILLIVLGVVFLIPALFGNFSAYIKISFFILSYLLVGHDVIFKALRNISRGKVFDENFLMVIATLGAFGIKEYSEAVAVMLFYKVGEFFQNLAVNNSRRSIKSLMNIRPDYANLQTSEGLVKKDPNDIEIDDIIVIKPGERVPLDGIIISGSTIADTSALTGESLPKELSSGDEILSGYINTTSSVKVRVTKTYSMSTVSKILDLVENAASKKAPTENFITKFSKYYTPVVVVFAVILAAVPPIVLGDFNFSPWIYRSLVFLVISCPCALVISVPLSFFSGIGAASANGILVKGSNYLESLNNVDTVVFDKTGTLTKGAFHVNEIVSMNGFSNDEVLEYAAYAEAHSNHPIAKSVINAYKGNIEESAIQSYEEIAGHGIKVIYKDKEILVGNDKAMHMNNRIQHNTCSVKGTVIHVAVNNVYAGYILVADEMKKDSKYSISKLKEMGITKIAMLTGDSKETAENIGQSLGIGQIYSELLPNDKVEILEKIKNESNRKVVFVGDGINDAPVLAMADIGISMGALGSDAAIESSDIVFMTDEPSKLVQSILIAKKTRRIVLQNIIFALGVKFLVLLFGVFNIATMWEAVFADVGVTVIAVFNSLRILKAKY